MSVKIARSSPHLPYIHAWTMAAKSRQLRSPVWEFSETVGEKKVRCKLCTPPVSTILAYHGGTTSMNSHLTSHHLDDKYAHVAKGSDTNKSQRKIDSFVHEMRCLPEQAEKITRQTAEIVARDLRPISINCGRQRL